ncbi:MAG: hydroxymethylbilane synthase [Candidatus Acidiferrales bacterium]
MKQLLRIGTRGSKLALWQANHLRDALHEKCGVQSEIVVIKTSGDIHATAPVEQIGIKGIFTAELEHALFDGRADLAIHSMKDVPTDFSNVCRIVCVFEREDPRDVLISRATKPLATLPQRARIGTSSVRRASQLRRARPDLEIIEIRGNVDSRIRKLDEGAYDGIVLARAGIVRLGLSARISEALSPEVLVPAVGQGALAVEYLDANANLFRFLRDLEHRPTTLAVEAERGMQRELHGGCRLPLGGWARFQDGVLVLDGIVLSEDGEKIVRGRGQAVCNTYRDAFELGCRVAREMLAAGADVLLEAAGRTRV